MVAFVRTGVSRGLGEGRAGLSSPRFPRAGACVWRGAESVLVRTVLRGQGRGADGRASRNIRGPVGKQTQQKSGKMMLFIARRAQVRGRGLPRDRQ